MLAPAPTAAQRGAGLKGLQAASALHRITARCRARRQEVAHAERPSGPDSSAGQGGSEAGDSSSSAAADPSSPADGLAAAHHGAHFGAGLLPERGRPPGTRASGIHGRARQRAASAGTIAAGRDCQAAQQLVRHQGSMEAGPQRLVGAFRERARPLLRSEPGAAPPSDAASVNSAPQDLHSAGSAHQLRKAGTTRTKEDWPASRKPALPAPLHRRSRSCGARPPERPPGWQAARQIHAGGGQGRRPGTRNQWRNRRGSAGRGQLEGRDKPAPQGPPDGSATARTQQPAR